MSHRFTVALRTCLNCQRTFGMSLWPWSGARFQRTHGLCRGCHRQLTADIDDQRPVEQSRGAFPPAA